MFCVKLAQTDGRRVRIRVCGLLVLHYYIYGYASKWMIPIPCRLPRSARRPSCKMKRNIMRWPIHAAAHTPHTPLKCVLNFNCALIPKIFSFACAKCDFVSALLSLLLFLFAKQAAAAPPAAALKAEQEASLVTHFSHQYAWNPNDFMRRTLVRITNWFIHSRHVLHTENRNKSIFA